MTKRLTVSLSGPALSLLLYENTKTNSGQEGFLLGNIVEHRNTTVTDTDQKHEHVETQIQINSAIPCPRVSYFYNGMGKLNFEKLDSFLKNLPSEVVAWYRYRRNTNNFKFTIREKIIHKHLAEYFGIPITNFACCILISHVQEDNESTHTFNQNFVRYNALYNCWDNLPLHIANLSDPNNTYKTGDPVSQTFNQVVKNLKIDLDKGQSVDNILKIQNALQKHIETVVDNLAEAEKEVFDLENEVKLLMRAKGTVKKDANTKEIKMQQLIGHRMNLRTRNNEHKADGPNLRGKRI